jgi:hypothetical protein
MLWATRQGCHVDRTACIWLIRRFIDSEAVFSFFGDPAEAPEEAELFDVVGARLSHRGEDCSFETFLKDYELEDRVLHEIAEIVHDADLMDEKYGRPESEGLDASSHSPTTRRSPFTRTCFTKASTPTSAGKCSDYRFAEASTRELLRTPLWRSSQNFPSTHSAV